MTGWARRIAGGLIAGAMAFGALPAVAQGLVRDAEIERTLRAMSTPIFQAAGIPPASIDIHMVNSRALNAFVAGGNNMFLNTGLMMALETPEELIGVIAHETGHIAGGHQARRAIAVRNARGPALLGLLAGIAIGAAGGGPAGAAIAAGSQSAVTRGLLSYNRGEEASADQAAMRYMARTGVDPVGLLKVMQRFRGQEVFTIGNTDPYVLTHPLSTQRVQLIERHIAEASARQFPRDPERDYWHARMRAKLEGFLKNPRRVLSDVEGFEEDELVLYRKAVALHRLPSPDEAIAAADRLIALRPEDPFYLELKGQILHESGRASEAVPLYRAAVSRAPNQPLLKAGLGRTLLALNTPEADAEALTVLKSAQTLDRADASALRDLAQAYSRAGDIGMATLATAERFALTGRNKDAVLHAKRAANLLPNGSPGWLRAQDILVLDRPED
ncbi:MAG: M48 family metalloprotease [Pseudomonadota bacterium]